MKYFKNILLIMIGFVILQISTMSYAQDAKLTIRLITAPDDVVFSVGRNTTFKLAKKVGNETEITTYKLNSRISGVKTVNNHILQKTAIETKVYSPQDQSSGEIELEVQGKILFKPEFGNSVKQPKVSIKFTGNDSKGEIGFLTSSKKMSGPLPYKIRYYVQIRDNQINIDLWINA